MAFVCRLKHRSMPFPSMLLESRRTLPSNSSHNFRNRSAPAKIVPPPLSWDFQQLRRQAPARNPNRPIRLSLPRFELSLFLQNPRFIGAPSLFLEPEQNSPGADKNYSEPIFCRRPFAENNHRENGDKHDAEL